MLQLMIDKASRRWKALGLPHSTGSVPVKLLRPSSRTIKDGKELLPAQEAGSMPLSCVPTRRSKPRRAKAPGLPHAAGRVPA